MTGKRKKKMDHKKEGESFEIGFTSFTTRMTEIEVQTKHNQESLDEIKKAFNNFAIEVRTALSSASRTNWQTIASVAGVVVVSVGAMGSMWLNPLTIRTDYQEKAIDRAALDLRDLKDELERLSEKSNNWNGEISAAMHGVKGDIKRLEERTSGKQQAGRLD